MLRIIFKTVYHNDTIAEHRESFKTLDIDIPAIENILNSGGHGNVGYEFTDIIGVEIISENKNEKAPHS